MKKIVKAFALIAMTALMFSCAQPKDTTAGAGNGSEATGGSTGGSGSGSSSGSTGAEDQPVLPNVVLADAVADPISVEDLGDINVTSYIQSDEELIGAIMSLPTFLPIGSGDFGKDDSYYRSATTEAPDHTAQIKDIIEDINNKMEDGTFAAIERGLFEGVYPTKNISLDYKLEENDLTLEDIFEIYSAILGQDVAKRAANPEMDPLAILELVNDYLKINTLAVNFKGNYSAKTTDFSAKMTTKAKTSITGIDEIFKDVMEGFGPAVAPSNDDEYDYPPYDFPPDMIMPAFPLKSLAMSVAYNVGLNTKIKEVTEASEENIIDVNKDFVLNYTVILGMALDMDGTGGYVFVTANVDIPFDTLYTTYMSESINTETLAEYVKLTIEVKDAANKTVYTSDIASMNDILDMIKDMSQM